MKARNRKTGEIVDIISYSQLSAAERWPEIDYVSYIDSKGVEHEKENLNYYWDFEEVGVDTQDKDSQHWQDIRERAAIAALQGLLANPELVWHNEDCEERVFIVPRAMKYAEDLVERLKEE